MWGVGISIRLFDGFGREAGIKSRVGVSAGRWADRVCFPG